MQTYPLPWILRQSLRANRDYGFIYLNNPKVGCSTVKANLWSGATGRSVRSIRDVHAREGAPFESDVATLDWAAGAFVFTFVRNPYARIVSAYLNKVVARRDPIWENFARLHGRDPEAPVSFDAFVEFLCTIAPEDLDPHWRPQHLNTLHPFVQPNLIADLAAMDVQLPDILSRLFPGRAPALAAWRRHGTGAQEGFRAHLGDSGTVRRVQQLYAGDFEAFGYRRDPQGDPGARQGPRLSEHGHPGLVWLARYHAAGPETRAALLDAPPPGGAALADWILAERLRLDAGPVRAAALLDRHAARIGQGPAFLRRRAAERGAGPGPGADAPRAGQGGGG